MRLALLAAVTTAAGLGACAPVPGSGVYGYGYSEPVAAQPYGYYDGGYVAQPYYGGPVYGQPYVAPGAAVFIGGERRYRDNDRYREERPRYEGGGYRGNSQNYGRQGGPANFGGRAAAPAPAPRPAPPQPGPGPGPRSGGGGGGHEPGFNPANPTGSSDR